MKKLVTTPITNTIWWETVNEEKGMITGKREDVTDNAIDAVFQHLIGMEGFLDKGFAGYEFQKKIRMMWLQCVYLIIILMFVLRKNCLKC